MSHPLASSIFFFFFNDTATTEIYTLSLHDALPISGDGNCWSIAAPSVRVAASACCDETPLLSRRSEEHTSELQSQSNLVCRLLLEKKKKKKTTQHYIKTNTQLKAHSYQSKIHYTHS